jgi:hypothetical protein
MNEVRHDEAIDHRFGSGAVQEELPDVIAMGPAHDDIEVIEMGPAPGMAAPGDDIRVIPDQPSLLDEVPEADAWEQHRTADPDAPPAPAPRFDDDPEVSPADAWEQAQLTDRYDDY